MKKVFSAIFLFLVAITLFVSCNDSTEGLFLSAAQSVEASGLKITELLLAEGNNSWILTNDGIVKVSANGSEMVLSKNEINFQYAAILDNYIYVLENNPSSQRNGKVFMFEKDGRIYNVSSIDTLHFTKLAPNGLLYGEEEGKGKIYRINDESIKPVTEAESILFTSNGYSLVDVGSTYSVYDGNGNLFLYDIPQYSAVGFEAVNSSKFVLLTPDKKVLTLSGNGSSFSTIVSSVQDSISTSSYAGSFSNTELKIAVFKTYNGVSIFNYETGKQLILAQKGFADELRNAGDISGIFFVDGYKYVVATSTSGVFEIDLEGFDATSSESATTTLEKTTCVNVYR